MRRGPADPVRELMHRHHGLCAGAVDPLEIAASLEAHGVTDRTAAGYYRHRDVFSLAEELFVRVPREPAQTRALPEKSGSVCQDKMGLLAVLAHVLPALLCGAGLFACRVLGGDPVRAAGLQAATVALTAAAAGIATRCGPLRASGAGRGARWTWMWICWLLAFPLCGWQVFDALLRPGPWPGPAGLLPAQSGGSAGLPDPATAAAFLGWAFAVLPAAWWAGRFARQSRRRLHRSRCLVEFSAGERTLLARTLVAFTALLLALLAGAFAVLAPGVRPDGLVLGGAAALGALLFTARLLAAHGERAAAAAGLATGCAIEAVGLGLAAVARWGGPYGAGRTLQTLARITDPALLQVVACSTAAVALIISAFALLGRAGAHCFAETTADLAVPPDQENR